ncbi:MAG: hypothetical protein HPY76_03060, partial [Anaerolineae bacterium]|nr:hypothetical protein [Anaerolineae bacterium]
LVKRFDYQAGVMISASHNPHHQNGIKIFNSYGQKLSPDIEAEIERLAESNSEEITSQISYGTQSFSETMRQNYINDLLSHVAPLDLTGVALLVDCANGAASAIAPECFSNLGAKVITINANPNGVNINNRCGSEYVRKYPKLFSENILKHEAAFGIAFDGDADRVIFADQLGRVIDGDNILAILSEHMAQEWKLHANTVVTSNMRNTGLANYLKSQRISLIETKVGDKYITDELIKLNDNNSGNGSIRLGGEQSGHIILLDDTHVTGDGTRTALFMLKIWNDHKRPLFHEFISSLVKFPQIIANAEVAHKPELDSIPGLSAMREKLERSLPGLERFDIRYSGTESLLRVMVEANTMHVEEELAEQALKICKFVQTASHTSKGDIEILNISKGGVISINTENG